MATPKIGFQTDVEQRRELVKIRERIAALLNKLEAEAMTAEASPQMRRLYFEVLDRERDRYEGKPHTAEAPKKAVANGESEVSKAIRKLMDGRAGAGGWGQGVAARKTGSEEREEVGSGAEPPKAVEGS